MDSKADLAADAKETFEEQFSKNAAEAARALSESDDKSTHGIHPGGSMWWKETGVEQRPDGVVCKWTVLRGVSADGAVEWEDKYWEASDRFDHKELGSEKSGRDAAGNVWREYWKESMWQVNCCHILVDYLFTLCKIFILFYKVFAVCQLMPVRITWLEISTYVPLQLSLDYYK